VTDDSPARPLRAAVLTVSDRCAAGRAEDTSGPAVAAELSTALAADVEWTGVVPDELAAIMGALLTLCRRGVEVVCTTGGTGLAARDLTPEATRALIDREVPGLAEAMRAASAVAVPTALLSRAVAGVRGRTLILNLPGSPRGAVDSLRVVAPVIPHAIALLRGDTGHPEQR
jgi:molybdopterin adenylyltransferase